MSWWGYNSIAIPLNTGLGMILNKKSSKYQIIHFNGMMVAGVCESTSNEKIELYFPYTVLVFMEKGTSYIRYGDEEFKFPPESYFLLRKYTPCTFFKTYEPSEGGAKFYVFTLRSEFLRAAIAQFNFPKNLQAVGARVLQLESTPALMSAMASIKERVEQQEGFTKKTLEGTTKEILDAITGTNGNLAAIFKIYALAARVDLVHFMQYNYLRNVTIEQLAKEAGRSLSTFHREFKLIFNETPHRWIMQRRLEYAKKILLNSNKKVIEICQEAGFQDLTHFGKVFKKQYGISPSTMQQQTKS